MCRVHCEVCGVHCAVLSVQITDYSVQCAVHSMKGTVCSVKSSYSPPSLPLEDLILPTALPAVLVVSLLSPPVWALCLYCRYYLVHVTYIVIVKCAT